MRILPFLAALALAACTQPDHAAEALRARGYTDIEITGYRGFSCVNRDENFRTGFRAKAPSGERVSGVVCSGWVSGAAIRLD